jgi:hypothetical protein
MGGGGGCIYSHLLLKEGMAGSFLGLQILVHACLVSIYIQCRCEVWKFDHTGCGFCDGKLKISRTISHFIGYMWIFGRPEFFHSCSFPWISVDFQEIAHVKKSPKLVVMGMMVFNSEFQLVCIPGWGAHVLFVGEVHGYT